VSLPETARYFFEPAAGWRGNGGGGSEGAEGVVVPNPETAQASAFSMLESALGIVRRPATTFVLTLDREGGKG